ncbi:hypothetical protein F2Q70_00038583 [Brassica cretica]|uniref:Uncharacterized protein n=1 Tax=Brassica cretica TaxID=69181 RepID=A0A8S9KDD2_BRACR|nr:hypothetical protein F2Q70_00038583 [Brassica cretica]
MIGNASRRFDRRSRNRRRRCSLAHLHIGTSLVTMGRRHVKNKRFGAREVLKILLYEKHCGRNASHRTRARRGSLRSNRTHVPLGRYVETELKPKLDRYIAIARSLRSDRAQAKARSLRSDRALPKRRYDISLCVLVYPSMISPKDRSEPISRFPAILSYQSNFTEKTAESSFFIERSRNKRFESEDGPKGPKT